MSDYFLPCHPYGENIPKQREFEGNLVALMTHAFTSVLLVDHECFHKLMQDSNPRLSPVGRSKMSHSLIPKESQLAERSVIGSMFQAKDKVIIYELWMSHKTRENFSLTEH